LSQVRDDSQGRIKVASFQVGDKVRLTRDVTVKHMQAGNLGITGKVVKIIPESEAYRPLSDSAARTVRIEMDDTGYRADYAPWELGRI